MPTKIAPELKELVIKLANEGLSKEKIAEKTKISRTSVYNILDDEDIVIEKDNSDDIDVGKGLTEKFIVEGYDFNDDIIQLIFNLKRLANKSGQTLKEFLEDIEHIIDQYYKHTNNPIKLFDFICDVSHGMEIVNKSFDIDKLIELIDNFIDKNIYIDELYKKFNSIEKFKEAKEKELTEIRQFQEQQFEKSLKIINQLKEINQTLSNVVFRAKNMLTNLKKYHEEKMRKIKLRKKQLKDLNLENNALNQIIKELEQQFPNEIQEYVKKIKENEKE